MSGREDDPKKNHQREDVTEGGEMPSPSLPRIKVRVGTIGPKPKIRRKPPCPDESDN